MIVGSLGWVEIRACQHFHFKPCFPGACISSMTIYYRQKLGCESSDLEEELYKINTVRMGLNSKQGGGNALIFHLYYPKQPCLA